MKMLSGGGKLPPPAPLSICYCSKVSSVKPKLGDVFIYSSSGSRSDEWNATNIGGATNIQRNTIDIGKIFENYVNYLHTTFDEPPKKNQFKYSVSR